MLKFMIGWTFSYSNISKPHHHPCSIYTILPHSLISQLLSSPSLSLSLSLSFVFQCVPILILQNRFLFLFLLFSLIFLATKRRTKKKNPTNMSFEHYCYYLFFLQPGVSTILSFKVFLCVLMFISVFAFWLSPGGLVWALPKTRVHVVQTRTAMAGPFGLPLLGFVFVFTGSLTHRVLSNLAEAFKAKSVMAFSVGFTRFIISSHPDTAKEILNSSDFADRPVKESAYVP